MAITHYYSFPYQIIIDFHGIRHFCQKEIRIGREQFNGTWKFFKFRFQIITLFLQRFHPTFYLIVLMQHRNSLLLSQLIDIIGIFDFTKNVYNFFGSKSHSQANCSTSPSLGECLEYDKVGIFIQLFEERRSLGKIIVSLIQHHQSFELTKYLYNFRTEQVISCWIIRRAKENQFGAIILLIEAILCFLVPLSLAVWLLISKLQTVNVDTATFVDTITNLADWIRRKTEYDLLSKENISSIASILPGIGQFLMGGISSFAVNLFVLVFVLYFMLIGGTKMEQYIYELLPFSDSNKKHVMNEINMIVRANAIGIPLLAIIQGAIATLGYYLFDAPSALLFGFLTCFATVIPIVGTTLVWFPLAAYMAISGDWPHAIGLLLYCGLIVTNIDNLIRFILQKKMADTHPLITIFGVVIGLSLFGFMGVIFGPLLISIFILCVNIFKEQYLK